MEEPILQQVVGYWWIAAILIFIVSYKLWLRLLGVVIIPDNHLGLVNKKFVLIGANATLPDGKIIALNGEAGYQADTLAPGLHVGYWPWQYQIDVRPFLTIPQGKLGVVQATDGKPLENGRVLARHVDCDAFQDARKFLAGDGQRGPQISIITPGTYRINTQLFRVDLKDATQIGDGTVGIVTTLEGEPLDTGKNEIAGRAVTGHKMFQDGQAFVDAGGSKGLQEQVILAGLYYLNPLFVHVETVAMTEVPMAHVGVVIAYVGDAGVDTTGVEFTHANLVEMGKRGVWDTPLDPGRYPINPHTHKVELVPTANIVLNWANNKSEAHALDERLNTIRIRSKDGFEANLDVSQIIHISRPNAPRVIARFGDMKNLVSQILEPIIGNDFRNAAQDANMLDFLRERTNRQAQAKARIKDTLKEFNVEGTDTLIGDLVLPEELMKTLTDRQLADERKTTYTAQQQAENTRTELMKASALADTQASVVKAERDVQIADFTAQSAVKKAEGQKAATIAAAEGKAKELKLVGDAEAAKISAIGKAEAEVIKQKQDAIGAENFTAIEVATRLSQSVQPLVPTTVLGTGEGGTSALLNLVAIDRLRQTPAPTAAPKKDTLEVLPADAVVTPVP